MMDSIEAAAVPPLPPPVTLSLLRAPSGLRADAAALRRGGGWPSADSGTPLREMQFQVLDVTVMDEPVLELEAGLLVALDTDEFVAACEGTAADARATQPPPWAPGPAGAVCTVCVFAVEASGASALLRVGGFRPHLSYEVTSPQHAQAIVAELRRRLSCQDLRHQVARRKRLYGWVPSEADPTLPSEADPTAAREAPVARVSFPTLRAWRAAARLGAVRGALPWEAKVDPIMQFFDATGVSPCGWVTLLDGTLRGPASRASHCLLEATCSLAHVRPLERMDMAPLLVASVDIECFSERGGFPDAERASDRVAIIGTSFWRVGAPPEDTVTVLQCVGDCDPVDGVRIECYPSECALLEAWRDLVCVHADADLVLGYNSLGFDFRYMLARARAAGCRRFWYSGRLIAACARGETRELQSNALRDNALTTLGWRGRVDVDLFQFVKAQHKLPSYKLDSVAEHFLGERKVDLPYAELFDCMREGAGGAAMARACGYCAEDCRLPLKLLRRLEVLPAMVEMSRVTRTSLHQLVFRGQQIKVYNQLVWHAHRAGYVLNDPNPPDEGAEGYVGATVIEPTPGFYDTPVATLDFASLYPSIMIAHNLCFSTHVLGEAHRGLPGVQYEEHVGSEGRRHTFVLSTPGVLRQILRDLLAARREAKRGMASAETPELRALYNARQLALKISCNSVYGFTGAAKRGMYADVAIADSVTCLGRSMIEETAAAVPAAFPVPCRVVYGDTNSVMVHILSRDVTPAAAFAMGERAAELISARFRESVTLEMEKVYMPFLLIAKKRYAAVVHEPNRQGVVREGEIQAKGVELVRRDNCPFAKRVYEQVLTPILRESVPARAVDNLRARMRELVDDAVPMADFVLSKALKKRESYVNQMQSHLVVADKITRRTDGALTPQSGNRLPFYIAEGREERVSERAEDPVWGAANGVRPDRLYYLNHQVQKPVSTLFAPFDAATRAVVAELLEGTARELQRQREGQGLLVLGWAPGGKTDDNALALPKRARPAPKRARVALVRPPARARVR